MSPCGMTHSRSCKAQHLGGLPRDRSTRLRSSLNETRGGVNTEHGGASLFSEEGHKTQLGFCCLFIAVFRRNSPHIRTTCMKGQRLHPHSQPQDPQKLSVGAAGVDPWAHGWTRCVYTCSGIVFSPEKEGNPDTCHSVAEPQGCGAERNEPNAGQMLCGPWRRCIHRDRVRMAGTVVGWVFKGTGRAVGIRCWWGLKA